MAPPDKELRDVAEPCRSALAPPEICTLPTDTPEPTVSVEVETLNETTPKTDVVPPRFKLPPPVAVRPPEMEVAPDVVKVPPVTKTEPVMVAPARVQVPLLTNTSSVITGGELSVPVQVSAVQETAMAERTARNLTAADIASQVDRTLFVSGSVFQT